MGKVRNKNYIVVRDYKIATTTVSGNIKDATQQVSYLDGLGRNWQQVSAHSSPEISGTIPSDIISSYTEYDGAGRISRVYGSYPMQGNGIAQVNAGASSVSYYNNSTHFCLPNSRGYTLTEYEEKQTA